jgi:protein phosphatase PTC7
MSTTLSRAVSTFGRKTNAGSRGKARGGTPTTTLGRNQQQRQQWRYRDGRRATRCRTATTPMDGMDGEVTDGNESQAVIVRSAGAILVPHPDKAEKGGEDACFVLKQSGAFGVFDGVGGWAEEGVDPAEYSEKFAEKSAESVLSGKRDPVAIMTEAHAETQVLGSCTACIAVLRDGSVLDIANLGDAGAMVARDGSVVYATPSQQHEFNLPYQLGWIKVYPEGDKPSASERAEVQVQAGDVLVMGSDGLWDNVPAREVAELCTKHDGDAEQAAEAIATLAFGYSCDPQYDSPFTQEARKAAEGRAEWADRKNLVGGKMDDIAVVVAYFDT